MANSYNCPHCGYVIPASWERCPHCALPGLFPNVRAAERQDEVEALDHRYEAAMQKVAARSCVKQAQDFEAAMDKSTVVLARSENEMMRLATDDNELCSTYYKLGKADVRFPLGEHWDVLREVADSALFQGYREHIRFAVLSLDGLGVENYGPFSLTLREHMIAHRTSVFEENSVLFMYHEGILIAEVDNLPKGRRATWARRGKLGLAKLAERVDSGTSSVDFPGILLNQGPTSADDEFIEAHIWGPISVRTCQDPIVVRRRNKQPPNSILRVLKVRLRKFGLTLEER